MCCVVCNSALQQVLKIHLGKVKKIFSILNKIYYINVHNRSIKLYLKFSAKQITVVCVW